MSRTQKTAKNSMIGLLCAGINYLLSFVLRALFIRLLGLEYAGINTLFADVLNILNLADLGFSNAILFRLYKTISEGDNEGTEAYLALYRKICYVVGIVVGIIGLSLIPFLGDLISKIPSFAEPLWSIYIIVLANSVANHVINYKSILLIAKQDRYVFTVIQYVCIFLRNALQILSLIIFKSIYLYLVSSLITTAIQGIVTGVVSKRRYLLSWKSASKIPKSEAKIIAKDVGSLSVYKICRTLDASIDTFLISRYIDIAVTAVYGSVMLILNALNELLGVFNDGMLASVGDLNAEGDKDHLEHVFYKSIHFTFLTYGVVTATLVPVLSDFCKVWIGHSVNDAAVYIMLLNFIMYGIGMNVATFRNSMGIFRKGWVRPAITAALNLVFSYILITKIGLIGTLIGTLIARTSTLVWYDPWLVLRYGMNKSPKSYYFRYVVYLIIAGVVSGAIILLKNALPEVNGLFSVIWHGLLFLILAVMGFAVLGFVLPEHKEIIKMIADLFRQLRNKTRGGRASS